MNGLESTLVLLGRFAICAFFLWTALEKVRHWNKASDYLKKKRVPHVNIVLPVAVVLQALGGLLLLFGFYPRFGALLLLLYMGFHVHRVHDFWNVHEMEERTVERLMFMKDIAIMGGLLVLAAVGGGHFGLSH